MIVPTAAARPAEPAVAPTAAERFEALWTAHYRSVLAYASRRAGPDLAADVAAGAFAVLWRRIDDPPTDPLPWLYAVARRELANQRRGDSRREALRSRLRLGRTDRYHVPDPADGATEGLRARSALARLRPADREVLMLVAWEGLDPAQAAAALAISPAAFAVRLHRARRRLESQLTDPKDPA